MTKKLNLFWKSNPEWWHVEGNNLVVNDDAPVEAKRSYKKYLKQIKKYTKNKRII